MKRPHPDVFDPQSGFVSRQCRLDPVSFLVQPLELHPLLQTLLPTGPHLVKLGPISTELVQGLLDVHTPCLPIVRAFLKRFPQHLHLLEPGKTLIQLKHIIYNEISGTAENRHSTSSSPAPLLLHLQLQLLVLLQQGDSGGHVSGRLLLQEALLHRASPALQLLGLLLEAL